MENSFLTLNSVILPKRKTPKWNLLGVFNILDRENFLNLFRGSLPIGKFVDSIITENERLELVKRINNLVFKEYDNMSEEQLLSVIGNPFVDASTLDEYLHSTPDEDFRKIADPLLERVLDVIRRFGYSPTPLIDSATLLPYHSKVCRYIHLPNGCQAPTGNVCTVLHCDDIIRDGLKKPDFRIPLGLEGKEYFQMSINILLEDGGYPADSVVVYEQMYSSELETNFLNNGWQYSLNEVSNFRNVTFTPECGDFYMFSTLNFHDVFGGHPKSRRLTFSIFFILVPEDGAIYYYN